MKKYLLSGLSIVALFLSGCGGGSGSGDTIDVAATIENKDFYRYIQSDNQYYKELFDGNGTLVKLRYLYDGDFIEEDDILDDNSTNEYLIDGSYVYVTENNVTQRCRVEDDNLAVIFSCLEVGISGVAEETIRWKSLEDAVANPE